MTRPSLDLALAVRLCPSLESAADVLEGWELCAIESLEDWRFGSLMAWALEGPAPDGLDAADLKSVRSMRLIGALASACERAMALGDARTARAMARMCNDVLLQTKGISALRAALTDPREDS